MKIAFDLDGVLCEEVPHSEKFFARPYNEAIKEVNKLYYLNNHIVIYTARSWPEYNLTHKWLKDNGVLFHQLIMGKYNYDVFIEDKSFKSVKEYMEK